MLRTSKVSVNGPENASLLKVHDKTAKNTQALKN